MNREELLQKMLGLLTEAVDAEGHEHEIDVSSSSQLVGGDAVLSSMGLVSFIMDIEGELDESYALDVTLVNESALSRKKSPFRTVESLTDYVLELAGEHSDPAESVAVGG